MRWALKKTLSQPWGQRKGMASESTEPFRKEGKEFAENGPGKAD